MAKSDKNGKRNALLAGATGVGALSGGALGLQALKLLPKEYKERVLQRLIADRPMIVASILAPELAGGSGEARMALNIARAMREKGIQSRLGIAGGGEIQVFKPNKPYELPAYRDSPLNRAEPLFSPTVYMWKGSHIDHNNLLKLNDLKVRGGVGAGDHLLTRMLETSGPEGKAWLKKFPDTYKHRMFKLLLSGRKQGLGIENFDKALTEIRSGKWDKFAPGRLATLLKLDNSLDPIIKDGPEFFLTGDEVASRLSTGRASGLLSAERGFLEWSSPSLWRLPDKSTVLESIIRRIPGLSEATKNRLITSIAAKSSGFSESAVQSVMSTLGNADIGARAPDVFPGRIGAYDQLLRSEIGAGVPNLGLLYNFKANYTNPADAFIPGIELPEPPKTLEELQAMRSAGRSAMFKEINRIRGLEGLANIPESSKIVFMSGGSVGPNGTQKLIDILDATKDMKDVHIFDQIGGSNPEFLDMVQNNSAYRSRIAGKSPEEIAAYRKSLQESAGNISDLEREYEALAKKYPGRFTLTSRLPKSLINSSIHGSNLYLPYGGSSSASEATAFLTPQLFTTDDMLNKGNLDYIIGKSNYDTVKKMDNTSTALERHLANNPEVQRLMGGKREVTDEVKGLLTEKHRLGLFGEQNPGAAKSPLTLDRVAEEAAAARRQNAERVRYMLSDATQSKAFGQENLTRVRNLVRDERAATDRLLSFTKDLVSDGEKIIERSDKGLRFGLGTGFRGGLKTGLKGLYLRLGRALSKGAVNARFAPAFAGLGLLGGGAGAYLLGDRLLKGKK